MRSINSQVATKAILKLVMLLLLRVFNNWLVLGIALDVLPQLA